MLILVRGLPGTGKSFFSEKFAQAIGAELFSSDHLRSELGLRGRYDQASKQSVYDNMFKRARIALAERRDCLLDATFSKQSRILTAQRLAEEFAVGFFVIEMTADEATVRKRVSQKRKFSEADLTVLTEIAKDYDPVPVDFLELDSSTKDIGVMTEEVKQYIGYDS